MYERLLQLILRIFVYIFLVISYDRFRDSLADGVDLRGMSSARDADADIDIGKFIKSDNK